MGCHFLQYTVTPNIDPWHHMTAQWYVHDILQPHVLPLMQRLPGAIFNNDWLHTARVSQDCLRTVTTLPWPVHSPALSSIEHLWDHLGRRVRHPTSLNELDARLQKIWSDVCLTISCRTCMPQCPIVSHRAFALEEVQ
ncbi:l-Fucosyltransferase [Trichonephila clavipes]|uniref:L-Fucosyltransferase n=1 Tax=Trichonephila clavipes TaxID=2585209 RepID=A0A8X6UWW9_TRICX|nr:l-Fucosyltransferase [Trichonephila clavipes]